MGDLVVSKTPVRISFLGGGTDYPNWYQENPGAVLATSIDKYCYLMVKKFPPFFEHKYMISYSEIERTSKISEIKHPSIRECIKYLGIEEGLDIHYAGDLPARTGMGTSSSFTVGFLKSLRFLASKEISNYDLALEAINIEQNIIKENVGSQDQIVSAMGGFNYICFGNKIIIRPVLSDNIKRLENHLMLFFTGFSRTATEVVKEQIDNTAINASILKEMYNLVVDGQYDIVTGDLIGFGKLLDYNWKLKKRLSSKVSTDYIDFLYEKAIKAGAVGGKLLGAGGGGFLLFLVEPDKQAGVIDSIKELVNVPFKFDASGSRVIYGDSK